MASLPNGPLDIEMIYKTWIRNIYIYKVSNMHNIAKIMGCNVVSEKKNITVLRLVAHLSSTLDIQCVLMGI